MTTTPVPSALEVGTALPAWELPLTPTLIVSTAIATRDFQDVHHDRDRAQAAGSQDVFMNILTSTALCQRYVEDSLGHDVEIRAIAIRLGAPAYPYDTLTFTGEVAEVGEDEVVLEVAGAVSLGAHVIGTVRLARQAGRAGGAGGGVVR
ncbi:MaoC family dehydratase [Nocardioides sp. TRM66260-LWL]|uniref:MaoC family dehydratase n=1 Tax=Nocardioides sp. TRM66260-LWL TaxID=2874478 RepID=UPI001CC4AF16|nr:MaoC family dehydratase [Nocardioides sp. TRM66260-LWL]MBZ5733438.1 MaoC family dehydratase [Nocardioides sp. TRM66260-LWL]